MSKGNRILIGMAAAILVATAIFVWLRNRDAAPPEPVTASTPAGPAIAPAVEHPLPGDAADARPPLPPLEASDAPLREGLAGLFGEPTVAANLVPDSIVRHVVATVDNLPRKKSPDRMRPIRSTAGEFLVDVQGTADQERIALSERNYARYDTAMSALAAADAKQVAELYVRWYPLMQEQYEELGYPGKYFNDRMVQVIDHLLETPEPKGPVELVRPNVLYEFADPALEARSAGQKTLIRMGPAHAATVKAKLRELRAIITNNPASFERGSTPPGDVPSP